jgi:hypothetical protein
VNRKLSDVVYRALLLDAMPTAAAPVEEAA